MPCAAAASHRRRHRRRTGRAPDSAPPNSRCSRDRSCMRIPRRSRIPRCSAASRRTRRSCPRRRIRSARPCRRTRANHRRRRSPRCRNAKSRRRPRPAPRRPRCRHRRVRARTGRPRRRRCNGPPDNPRHDSQPRTRPRGDPHPCSSGVRAPTRGAVDAFDPGVRSELQRDAASTGAAEQDLASGRKRQRSARERPAVREQRRHALPLIARGVARDAELGHGRVCSAGATHGERPRR